MLENIILKRNIKRFFKENEKYMKDNSLTTFADFVMHGYNGITSSTYGKLMDAPKFLLVASITFRNYYSSLDSDLQKDFFESKGMYSFSYFAKQLRDNKTINGYLKKILEDDFYNMYNNLQQLQKRRKI